MAFCHFTAWCFSTVSNLLATLWFVQPKQMTDNALLPKRSIYQSLALFISACFASCAVAPMYLRNNQVANAGKTDGVIRIYIDKFGSLYPSIDVPIDSDQFKKAGFLQSGLKGRQACNLFGYFTSDPQRLSALTAAYHIPISGSPATDFQNVQMQIVTGYVEAISAQVKEQQAGMVVFLVHGFNEPYPEADVNYPTVEGSLLLNPDAARQKPVFVEIYWDGLNAFGHATLKEMRIWPYARDNSRWVGLSLRNIIYQLEQKVRLPLTVVTHSLGAGVATCALFNTTYKWHNDAEMAPGLLDKIHEMMAVPTPSVEVRLGMLAPAIGGQPTFVDFNKRSPADITAAQNNISRVVIGYDPFDFATSKDVLKITSLAPYDGSTTLGCDYYWPKSRITDMELVANCLIDLGYNPSGLLFPVRFDTGVRPFTGGNHEHFMQYYMCDTTNAKRFFEDLFK